MTVSHILQPRQRDLGGGFLVRRLLPAAAARAVGPFVFLDHFGPVVRRPADNFDVRPHPHIGLATVSYLFEGAMLHRDSLGSVQRIEPGAINWMTAGRGIVHSERAPPDMRSVAHRMHGLQLWVGLPSSAEETEPAFHHTAADRIPACSDRGLKIRVLIGRAFGFESPVLTSSPTLYLDVEAEAGAVLDLGTEAAERAIYPVDGALQIDGAPVAAGTLAVLAAGTAAVRAQSPSRFVVLGGAPLDGPRFLWWNFVSSSKERIERAKLDWQQQKMGTIPGETEFIPLPEA
ncbi:MAG TPA: pirin family protein [Burkholderiaceae bacterium]